jgi:ABC-type nitrate/sulfonate/bicarbonate transport system substrate-binding protein
VTAATVFRRAATAVPALRVSTIPFDSGSAAFYAADLGFFTKAGLDVTVTPVNNGPAIAAAVASGATDIGFSNALSIATAYKRGLPFVFVGPSAVYASAAPTALMMVPKDSPLKTARDLNGKTIAINGLKSISEYMPSRWIEANGGDPTTVKYIEIPPSDVPAALASHRVDAAIVAEPQITQAKASSRVFADVYDVIGDGYVLAAYFTTRAWADAHPDLVRKFDAAMREAAQWANANPDKSAEILAKYTKLDPALVRASVRAKFGETLTPGMIQPLIDLAAHFGVFASFPAQEIVDTGKR